LSPGFIALKRAVTKRGLDCHQYKDSYLLRRFKVRMRATGSSSLEEYLEVLESREDELPKLLNALTINVTEFFRNPSCFQVFRRVLLELKKQTNNVRIWSAGCATGEEPYSIAMMTNEVFNGAFRVIATDIDQRALEIAKKGVYPVEKLKPPNDLLTRHYLEHNLVLEGSQARVRDEIKKKVSFQRHDLISGNPPCVFDVIFCRNVVIYFSRQMQENLYLKFSGALKKKGYLVLGKTEMLTGPALKDFETIDGRERIYRKIY